MITGDKSSMVESDLENLHIKDSEHEDLVQDESSSLAEAEEAGVPNSDGAFYEAPTVEMQPKEASLVSYLLGFLSPGTFLSVQVRTIHGVNLNFGLSVLFLAIPVICVLTGLFPVPLLCVPVILLLSIWGYGIWRTIRRPVQELRPLEFWAQAGLAFLSFWLPFSLSFFLSSNYVLQRTWMGNDTMSPGMHRGDIVLVDRLAYHMAEPEYGDLVMVEEEVRTKNSHTIRAFFGRVIAMPGDSVQLNGVRPNVNGKNLTQYYQRSDNDVFDRPVVNYELPYSRKEHEDPGTEPANWYPVLATNQLLFSQTNQVTLDAEYYYILEDNRDSGNERVRSSYGSIVHRSEIIGRPRYVIYNTESEQSLSRYGIALR